MEREDFENLFKKIRLIAGGGNQKEVAEKLGISPQAISDAKRKNRIPESWYVIIHEQFGVTRENLLNQFAGKTGKVVPLFKNHPSVSKRDSDTASHEQSPDALGYEQIMNEFFELVKQWQAEVNGRSSRTAIDFIQEFPSRFGEMEVWQKKKEKGKLCKFDSRKPDERLMRGN